MCNLLILMLEMKFLFGEICLLLFIIRIFFVCMIVGSVYRFDCEVLLMMIKLKVLMFVGIDFEILVWFII